MRVRSRHDGRERGRRRGRGRERDRTDHGNRTDRGQAFALEAVVASLILLGGLVFALQATAVTPLSASTSSQHIENQQAATAEGVLAAAAENGSLRAAVLNWNTSGEAFFDAEGNQSYLTNDAPDNAFGDLLSRAFDGRGIVYNVYVHHWRDRDDDGRADERTTQRLLYRGEPTDNAAAAARTVTLYDDDELYDDSNQPSGTVVPGPNFYAEDVTDVAATGSDTAVYNVVTVEVVVWRQ